MTKNDALALLSRLRESTTLAHEVLTKIYDDHDLIDQCGPDIEEHLDDGLHACDDLLQSIGEAEKQIRG